MDKVSGTAKAVAHEVLLMKPKEIACNEHAYIEWMIAKAFDLGYMYRVCEERQVKTLTKDFWK